MAETGYYDSPMTGEELDAAFAKMAGIDESVRQAAQSAETARQYGQIVEQNAQAIRDIEENLDVILEAPSQAQAASQSAERAAASEASAAGAAAQAGQSASAAAQSAEQAQQVAQGAQGWYETEEALRAAHTTGENGQWAIVGSTDTIWTWDSDTSAWVNTGSQMDLSGYYTKEQSDERYATAAQGKKADTAVQSVNGVSASAGEVTIPVGAQIELLWTNPSFESGSTFAPQTVSVDLSGYAFVMIEFLPFGQQWYDWTGKAMRLYPVGSTGNLEFMLLNQVGGQTGAIIECVSRLFYTSSSGVTFQNNVYTGDGGHTNLRNDWGVPTKIYGIKL